MATRISGLRHSSSSVSKIGNARNTVIATPGFGDIDSLRLISQGTEPAVTGCNHASAQDTCLFRMSVT
jgi:hypothetical protein